MMGSMKEERFYTYPRQKSAYTSPRSKRELFLLLLWQCVWGLLCMWTPKPFNGWRLFWLRSFGCKFDGRPFVHSRARIEVPWNLIMHDRACLGDRANVYSLGMVELGARCTIAQEAYLCSGTHDFEDLKLPLKVGKITIGEDAFLGARVFVMPGVAIGAGSVIGAGSLVTMDMPEWTICYGHPCSPIKPRRIVDKGSP
jgi:putative colanic acid biosynthesis acetyltransferase WcaF